MSRKRKNNFNDEEAPSSKRYNPDGSLMDIRKWMTKPREIRRRINNKNFFPEYIRNANIPDDNHYKIISKKEEDFPKYGLKRHITRFTFKIPENKNRATAEELFKDILRKLIDDAYDKRNVKEGWKIEKFHMELDAEVFWDPVVIPLDTRENNTPDMILNAFLRLEQSYRGIKILHQQISAYITTVAFPVGQGKLKI